MKELVDQLKKHEGVRSHVYDCPMGYQTIGVGRNIDCNGGIGISDDEIDYLLENDIRRCEKELDRFSWFADMDMVRQDALINMCFNLGFTRLLMFKNMLAALADGKYKLAAVEALDSRWAKQVGQRSRDIAHMFEHGTYP
jgi:lysozyme